jgi:cold shock CspA family protein
MKMNGRVKFLAGQAKSFGFIIADDGPEFFFHRDDFTGHWDDLKMDVNAHPNTIPVSFDIVESPKGRRAGNVRRLDDGVIRG